MVLYLDDFSYSFCDKPLLKRVKLYINPGEIVGIAGVSGSGKSTLLNLIAGLKKTLPGQIRVTKRISYMWQRDLLLPWRTVFQNVMLPCELRGEVNNDAIRARDLLEEVGLGESLGTYPHELSIGMRQRAAFAAAIITEPELLLLDEPFAAIDSFRKRDLYALLLRMRKKMGLSILLVSHQLEDFKHMADRIYLLEEGSLVEKTYEALASL